MIVRLLINKCGSGLNSIAGPFLAGFTNLRRVFITSFSDPVEHLVHLHRKFNSHFVRLGPRVVSISDPALIPTIYGINTDFRKTEFYPIIDLWHNGKFAHSLCEHRDEDYHTRIRRSVANAFSMTAVMESEPAVDSTVELLMSKLDQCEILFSRKLGCLESGTDVESVMSGIRFFDKYWQAERSSWKASGHATKRDFLERCIEAQAKYPDVVNDRMVVLHNFNNIGAGSDTTATTLISLMYHLLKNPRTLQKVLKDLDRANKEGCLSRTVTWQEAGKLSYFQACIQEALRMHPPIGMIQERYVPKGGISMGGHYFPEGTIVEINPWLTARNREVYGADSDSFRPERWLDASKDQLTAMEGANFVFSFARPDLEWTVNGGWMMWQDDVHVGIKRRAENYTP
ncbi:hypothetical protein A1O7_05673 [Cladophialophora yegresii CBS 114405]|uniref:Cytochrome P450 oxidoreductase n=1 Tax=Cladophialophora yegresii CBS 114405 TaxID=1182544 RepID=W9VRQ6_9EURO|nr:uncharacterized protein A1O7_05673 [Cladophialophora yegresii CBS 114405]EXJ58248.1 hypothetical protein A1O7_05673 [Cladophialophora yegresii CBS 114405]